MTAATAGNDRDAAAVLLALGQMVADDPARPIEAEAVLVGRAVAALALSTATPDAYLAELLGELRREMVEAVAADHAAATLGIASGGR